jgi:uncharacterized membrane protein (UPF0182 family)
MKDISFTIKRQQTELKVFAICFLISFILNVISIIVFKTEWKELYTQMGFVLLISVALYFAILLCRLLYWLVRFKILSKK